MKFSLWYVCGFVLLFNINLQAQNLLGPDKVQAKISGQTYQKSFNRPVGSVQAELTIKNGSSDNIVYKTCSGSKIQKALCEVENLLLKAFVLIDRPDKVEIQFNGQTVVSTASNLPKEKGSIKVIVNLQNQNVVKATVKGLPTSNITISVKGQAIQNQLPIARIVYQGENGVAPETIQFSGLTSSDPDGQITNYEWSFGDGAMATGTMVTHIYQLGGSYNVTLRVTDNLGAQSITTQNIVIQSNLPPVARIALLGQAQGIAPFTTWFDGSGSSDPDGQSLQYSWNFGDGGTSNTARPVHAFTNPGSYTVTLTVMDSFQTVGTASIQINVDALQLPPNPVPLATALPVEGTSTGENRYGFLYQGPNPIQRNAVLESFDQDRVLAVRGQVLDGDSNPLPGVKVHILSHPEYGYTYSREDGGWDIAFNGGGLIVVSFEKLGHISAQRKVETNTMVAQQLEPVLLVKKDSAFTVINLANNQTGTIHSGTTQTDQDGPRKTSVFVPPGTQAQIVTANGSRVSVDQLTLRVTEVTVGADGVKKMPAELPPRTAYTFAADFSADEADAFGADRIEFSQLVPMYVDNFLNSPVGSAIPLGYLNPTTGHWEGMRDGITIRMIGQDAQGNAQLDMGSGSAADSATLAVHNISSDELKKIGSLYAAGSTFWRATTRHFSFMDWNYNFYSYANPQTPNVEEDKKPDDCKAQKCCKDTKAGCIISAQQRTMSESIDLYGTDFSLEWNSDRAPGYFAGSEVKFKPITEDLLNARNRLKKAVINVEIAGKKHSQTFENPSLTNEFRYTWDGTDAYGRQVSESTNAYVTMDYYYDTIYANSAWNITQDSTFDTFSAGVTVQVFPGRRESVMQKVQTITLTSPFNQYRRISQKQFGGYSINIHHTYDPILKQLLKGDGSSQAANQMASTISTIIGNGQLGNGADGGLATATRFNYPREIFRTSTGDYILAEAEGHKIRKIDGKTGIVSTVAGTGVSGYSGDGGPAINAQIDQPTALQVAEDGTIYFASYRQNVIRKISRDGIITRIAGMPNQPGYTGNNGPAVNALLSGVRSLVLGRDGSLYFSEDANNVIRRIWPDGRLTVFAGTGIGGFSGDGGLASDAQFNNPNYTAMDPLGNMYVVDSRNFRIRKISPTGIVETIAGNGTEGNAGDENEYGGPALEASMGVLADVAVNDLGEVFFVERTNNQISFIDTKGIMNVLVGTGAAGFNGDGKTGPYTDLNQPRDIFLEPNGNLLIVDTNNQRVRRLSVMPSLSFGSQNKYIPSSNGSEIYVFNLQDQHIQTLFADTWSAKYIFRYDSQNFVTEIEDGFGKVVSINRSSDGRAVRLTTHYGQNFTFQYSGNYLSSVTTPISQIYRMTFNSNGLMTQFSKPAGNSSYSTYDPNGKLSRHWDDAGGESILTTDSENNNYFTTREGITSTHKLENDGYSEIFRNTKADGYVIQTQTFASAFSVTTESDGTSSNSGVEADPRLLGFSDFENYYEKYYPSAGGNIRRTENREYSYGSNLAEFTRTKTIVENFRTEIEIMYDSATRTHNSITRENRRSSLQVNEKNQPILAQLGNLAPTSYQYDSLGRLNQIQQGDRTTIFGYDANGFINSIRDPENRTMTFQKDAIGRTISETRNDGRSIQYGFDQNSNLSSVTPPDKLIHELAFSLADLISAYRGPASSPVTYNYDFDKRITTISRGDGRELSYSYFGIGNQNGKLSQVSTPDFTIRYNYDPVSKRVISAIGSDDITTNYTYAGDKILTKNYDGEDTINYTYRPNGMIVNSETINGQTINFDYDFDDSIVAAGSLSLVRDESTGLVREKIFGSFKEIFEYNSYGEIIRRIYSANNNPFYQETYTRDRLGRISQRFNQNLSTGSNATLGYTYDSAGRLAQFTNSASLVNRNYSYDSNGNRTGVSGTTNITATYDSQDRLIQQGSLQFDYNGHGELSSKLNTSTGAATTYQYTSLGQLRRVVVGGSAIEYVFDGENKRVGRSVNGVATNFWLYDAKGRLVAELNSDGSFKSRFIYLMQNHSPDYMIQGGQNYFFMKDHLGSITNVIRTSTGTTVQAISYTEFGVVASDTSPGFQPFGFAGGHYDPATGLVRFGARDYDASIGRWTAKDPILFGGQQSNLYAYVDSDPINLTDSNGLGPFSAMLCRIAARGVATGARVSLAAQYGDNVTKLNIEKEALLKAECPDREKIEQINDKILEERVKLVAGNLMIEAAHTLALFVCALLGLNPLIP